MAKDVEVAERGSSCAKDYHDPPPAPLIDAEELGKWSFYRAVIPAFIATLLFLYITVLTDTVISYKSQSDTNAGGDVCGGVGILGISWAFGGMIFILVYCTAGISEEVNVAYRESTYKRRYGMFVVAETRSSLCFCADRNRLKKGPKHTIWEWVASENLEKLLYNQWRTYVYSWLGASAPNYLGLFLKKKFNTCLNNYLPLN